jgi:hypothetical protein
MAAFANAGFENRIRQYTGNGEGSVEPSALKKLANECERIGQTLTKIRTENGLFSFTIRMNEIYSSLLTLGPAKTVYQHISKWLEDLLTIRDITALVVSMDSTAILAMDFLINAQRQVPKEISVIGFDDSRMAHEYGLSSYNFDFAGIAKESLLYLLNPRHQSFAGGSLIECGGIIMERSSLRDIS